MSLKKGVFISDLHLLTRRCDSEFLLKPIYGKFNQEDDCIVLGGDIFDFKWSTLGSLSASYSAAIDWLRDLLRDTGSSHVVYLSGNHDCHPAFEETLQSLAQAETRFEWREHDFRLDDTVFLHGDILDAKGPTLSDLRAYRKQFHHATSKPDYMHRLYDVAVALRVHLAAPQLVRSKHKTCQKLGEIVRSVLYPEDGEIRRVIFGHTHAPIRGQEMDGIQFFNPGAMLKHAKYEPVCFYLD